MDGSCSSLLMTCSNCLLISSAVKLKLIINKRYSLTEFLVHCLVVLEVFLFKRGLADGNDSVEVNRLELLLSEVSPGSLLRSILNEIVQVCSREVPQIETTLQPLSADLSVDWLLSQNSIQNLHSVFP